EGRRVREHRLLEHDVAAPADAPRPPVPRRRRKVRARRAGAHRTVRQHLRPPDVSEPRSAAEVRRCGVDRSGRAAGGACGLSESRLPRRRITRSRRDSTVARPRRVDADRGLRAHVVAVLLAPTVWASLIEALASLRVNVIVKLHDRSCDQSARGAGGVDWRAKVEELAHDGRVVLAPGADASPYLVAADAMVTDHSSAGFEFMLLDRPLVVVDCPQLVEKARISLEKVRLLRSAAEVVDSPRAIACATARALERPERQSDRRRAISRELFYRPGEATARAAACLYDVLSLPAPSAVRDAGAGGARASLDLAPAL